MLAERTVGQGESGKTAVAAKNHFAGLSSKQSQPNFVKQMQDMMGGMLQGMKSRLSQANGKLRSSVTGQIDRTMSSIGELSYQMLAIEQKLEDVVTNVGS